LSDRVPTGGVHIVCHCDKPEDSLSAGSRNSSQMTVLLAIFACLLWSTAFVGVKIGLRYSGPFSFAGLRFMLAGLLLIPFWWARRPNFAEIQANFKVILLVSFFQTFFMYGLFYKFRGHHT
jgi:drug/metabolite transporter (DMT)-like permease